MPHVNMFSQQVAQCATTPGMAARKNARSHTIIERKIGVTLKKPTNSTRRNKGKTGPDLGPYPINGWGGPWHMSVLYYSKHR